MTTATAHALAPQHIDNTEFSRDSAQLSQVFERAPGSPGSEALPAAVREIVELCDGTRPIVALCKAARISEAQGLAVVRKLTSLGILRVRRPRPARALRSTGFSELEEAFFASDVAPIDECDMPFESVGEKLRNVFTSLLSGAPA